MPKPRLPLNDDSLPRFPAAGRTGAVPGADEVARYVIAVLDRIDPAKKGAHTASPATDRLMAKFGAKRLSPEHRPSAADWWGYLNDRLRRAPISSVQAVRAWGEQTLLAALSHSSQGDESTARIDDFTAILAAVDPSKLDPNQRRTLDRLRQASGRNWVQHSTAWEGFEQLIVPLPPLDQMFEPARKYSREQAAKILSVSPGTIKSRIVDGLLTTIDGTARGKIAGAELNRAIAAGVFKPAPRGATK